MRILRNYFLRIWCLEKILRNLVLGIQNKNNLFHALHTFLFQIKLTIEKYRKVIAFCGIYFCRWKFNIILRNLYFHFRGKCTIIYSAIMNFARINSAALINSLKVMKFVSIIHQLQNLFVPHAVKLKFADREYMPTFLISSRQI